MAVKNIICIVGRTASGKDTIARELEKRGLRLVVSSTTRPIRPSETEGKEHYFINEEQAAKDLENMDNIAAYTEINDCKYYTTIEELEKSNVYVIDPNGIRYLKEKHPDIRLIVVYVSCMKITNRRHALDRGDAESTFEKRYAAESIQFTPFEADPKNYDIIIHNESTLKDLIKKVDEIYDVYKNNTNELLNNALMEMYPDDCKDIVMFECPNYASAVIGISDDKRIIYDYDKMIEHLMKYDHMEYDEAMEFIEYNTIRALPYCKNAPIISYPVDF